ncbi:MAG: EAL domain-containing protein [Dissulfurispiraceae bacterium]
MQNSLGEAEIKLFQFLETLPMGIFVLDSQGTSCYANTKAQEMLGKVVTVDTQASQLVDTFNAYVAGTDRKYPQEEMPIVRALAGETVTVNDIEIRRGDRSVYLAVTGYPVYDETGSLLYAVAACTDITRLKETDAYRVNYIETLEGFASQLMSAEGQLKKSYETTRSIIEKAPLGIIVMNEDGKVEYVNKAMLDLGGATEQQLKNTNLLELPAYQAKGLDRLIKDVFKGITFTSETFEYTSHFGNKTSFRKFTGIPFCEGLNKKALIFIEDLTEQKKAENVLRQAKQDWENTFNSIADMITIHDREFNILHANTAAQDILHLDLLGLDGAKCFEHFHGEKEPHKECAGCECLVNGKYTVSEMFEPHLNKFIEVRATPRFDAQKDITRVIHVVRDITERKKLENDLMHQALYDTLTNLPNRVLLLDRIQNLYDHQKRQKNLLFAVLFIDLDEFKKINDSLGHIIGDELLLSVARRLLEFTRPGDTTSRFGGDEFVILLDDLVSEEHAVNVAVRIHEAMLSGFNLNGREVFISASIGIALSDSAANKPEDLLRNADIAMYNAKTTGKARYSVFDKSMHAEAVDSLTIENDLRKAIQRDELLVYYQPIVDIHTKRVSGFEALARWLHPVRGFIPPAKFIPIAESTGLIESIGAFVLKDACKYINQINARFPHDPALYVSVNLSAKQFNSKLPALVAAALLESSLESGNLRLEITEGTIMENIFTASSILHDLKTMGVQVYLDDFGTGYSSLNYLHKFPVNALKIDSSFTRNIQGDKQAQEILKSILVLATNLEMKMIIEGVEDQEQLNTFKDLNCQFIQGFLYSHPLPTSELFAFMEQAEEFVARITDKLR